MLIAELTLERQGSIFMNEDIDVCLFGLQALFQLPDDAVRITLELHNRRSKMRVPVPVKWNSLGEFPFLVLPNSENYDYHDLDTILKPFVNQTLYLGCYHD